MEDLIKNLNDRQELFDFINSRIELEAQKLYTKEYEISSLFEDFLKKNFNALVQQFDNRISPTEVKQISKEFLNTLDDKKMLSSYLNTNTIESFINK